MHDLAIDLSGRADSLARFGEVLAQAGISLEGGGLFTVDGIRRAHFLVEDGESAKSALEAAGLGSATVRPVLIRRLKQEVPGQLGAIARALADAGVNIETQYSDHANQLVLVVDDTETAARVTSDWAP